MEYEMAKYQQEEEIQKQVGEQQHNNAEPRDSVFAL
jgi:hypothetical protein